jgi:hypothetical protein
VPGRRVGARENRLRSAANSPAIVVAFVGLSLVLGFYLMTGIVYEEGGYSVQLVVKPYPSLTLSVGGGMEKGTWQRQHSNEPKPWWLEDHFVPLVRGEWKEIDDFEGASPWWVGAYLLGFLATLLSWLVLGGVCVFRGLQN